MKWFDVDKSKGPGLLISWCGEERGKEGAPASTQRKAFVNVGAKGEDS